MQALATTKDRLESRETKVVSGSWGRSGVQRAFAELDEVGQLALGNVPRKFALFAPQHAQQQ